MRSVRVVFTVALLDGLGTMTVFHLVADTGLYFIV